jgi:hypothetical protein
LQRDIEHALALAERETSSQEDEQRGLLRFVAMFLVPG